LEAFPTRPEIAQTSPIGKPGDDETKVVPPQTFCCMRGSNRRGGRLIMV